MADSKVYSEAERAIRAELPKVDFFKAKGLKNFCQKKLPLSPGGEFEFDAVDDSGVAAVNIYAGQGKTHRGQVQSGTINKIYKDIYFLSLAKVNHRAVVFAQEIAFEVFNQARNNGRIPKDIKLLHVPVSKELQKRLLEAGEKASQEVRPR